MTSSLRCDLRARAKNALKEVNPGLMKLYLQFFVRLRSRNTVGHKICGVLKIHNSLHSFWTESSIHHIFGTAQKTLRQKSDLKRFDAFPSITKLQWPRLRFGVIRFSWATIAIELGLNEF